MKLKKQIKTTLISTLLIIIVTPAAALAHHTPQHTACQGITSAGNANCDNLQAAQTGLGNTVQGVVNILLFVVGVAAVIMLIVGAIRYIVSAGDQQAVAGAKNTIIYSIVGIIVAVIAFAIVNFVLSPQGVGQAF